MRKPLYLFGLAAIFVASAALLIPSSGQADGTAYKPVMSIKNIMKSVNHEEFGIYGQMKAWVDSEPSRGDKEWPRTLDRAMLMAEMGNILQYHEAPKGDQASWKEKAAAFSAACKKLKVPCSTRKADKLKEALAEVRKRCDACHDAHRPE